MKIGIVGATGEVGRTFLKVMEDFDIQVDELRLFSSERSAGKVLTFKGKEYLVEKLTEDAMKEKYDYLLFSAGANVSRHFAKIAAENGNTVIDNSSAFRMEKDIPLVVPEINGNLLKGYSGIIANPNCSTIQMVLALYEIERKYVISEIFASTYQAVSGAGHKAIDEYNSQLSGSNEYKVFAKQIAHNVIPLIGDFEKDITTEEWKMINETRKILNSPRINVYPTTVRVPVYYGHSESVYVRTYFPIGSKEELVETLKKCEDVVVTDEIVTPKEIAGRDEVFVSRIRYFDPHTFALWIVADNIRVGAATNAIRILLKHRELNSVENTQVHSSR